MVEKPTHMCGNPSIAWNVHDSARRGFAFAADAYEESRPTYPDEAVAWLTRELELGPGRTVVDLAAGTGKLTRLLTPTDSTVIAIEPVDEMRRTLAHTTPDADARPGTAERTGLPDAIADSVTVAQAFHWFDGPAALAEIHRIMKPHGRLAVIYNVRDLDDPAQHAVDELLAPYRGHTPSHRSRPSPPRPTSRAITTCGRVRITKPFRCRSMISRSSAALSSVRTRAIASGSPVTLHASTTSACSRRIRPTSSSCVPARKKSSTSASVFHPIAPWSTIA